MKDPNFHRTLSLEKIRFTECLIRANALDDQGFEEWIFCPGMLFNALDKWWGDHEKRDRPHEGLDLCLYRDRWNGIRRLKQKAKIPAIHDGVVVGILSDFLGESLIVEHDIHNSSDIRFCSIYGHTNPSGDLRIGTVVRGGDIIASLAGAPQSRSHIFPHLHLSFGWIQRGVSYDKLDWETIGSPNMITLVDPLLVIDFDHMSLDCALPPQEDLLKALQD